MNKHCIKALLLLFLLSIVFGLFGCDFGIESSSKNQISFIVDGNTRAIVVIEDDEITFPQNPTKTDYEFDGWYFDEGVWKQPLTESSTISGDVKVYAKWSAVHNHSYTKEYMLDVYLKEVATCTTPAIYYKACSCGDKGTETFEGGIPLGHDISEYESNNDATCIKDGTKTGFCSRCHVFNTITDYGSKLAHNFTVYVSNSDATCVKDGTKTAHCDNEGCNATNTITDEGTLLGHNYVNPTYKWNEKTHLSCVATITCLRCKGELTESAKISRTTTQEKTCEKDQKTKFTATYSNEFFTIQEVEITTALKTGHSYSKNWSNDETYHWHQATCEHSTEYIDKDVHIESDWIIDKNATKQEAGSQHKECSVCNRVLKTEEISQLAKGEIEFSSLVFDNENKKEIVFDNSITTYSFVGEVIVKGDASYSISTDASGKIVLKDEVVTLKEGSNYFYINIKSDDGDTVYEVHIYRKPLFTVSFNTNGGSSVKSQKIEEDKCATIPTETPTRTGYSFDKWDFDFTKEITSDVVVKAVWIVHKYKIAFNQNYGAGKMEEQSFTYDEAQKISLNLFTKKNNTFKGWATTYNGSVVYQDNQSVINLSAEDGYKITLYAVWNANVLPTTYSITYELNGGCNNTENPSSYSAGCDDIVLKAPVKDSTTSVSSKENKSSDVKYNEMVSITTYKFEGWYSDSGFKNKVESIPSKSTGNKTLYAKWTETTTKKISYVRDGNTIWIGSYPQTDVTSSMGNTLGNYVKDLPTASNSNGWTSYGYYIAGSSKVDYMWYKDVSYTDGNKYRAVYFNQYRPSYTSSLSSSASSFQDNNGYTTNNVYWFRFDPIQWKVLEVADGKAILWADIALDSQPANSTTSPDLFSYRSSEIITWINTTFYDTAFTNYEKASINFKDHYALEKWKNENAEHVTLLSYNYGLRTDWGFGNKWFDYSDNAKVLTATGYAKAQGVQMVSGKCYWLTSNGGGNRNTCVNDNTGTIINLNEQATCTGISPIIEIYLDCQTSKVTNSNPEYGSISNSGTKAEGIYSTIQATANIDCVFEGWYDRFGLCHSTDTTYTYLVSNYDLYAKFKKRDDLSKFTYRISDDGIIITGVIDNTATEITLPEDIFGIDSKAFENNTALRKITMQKDVEVAYDAFSGCTNLTTIELK